LFKSGQSLVNLFYGTWLDLFSGYEPGYRVNVYPNASSTALAGFHN
jgi:hypothetical protein